MTILTVCGVVVYVCSTSTVMWCVDFIVARFEYTHGKMRNIEIYDLLEKYNNSNDNTNNNKIIVNKAIH